MGSSGTVHDIFRSIHRSVDPLIDSCRPSTNHTVWSRSRHLVEDGMKNTRVRSSMFVATINKILLLIVECHRVCRVGLSGEKTAYFHDQDVCFFGLVGLVRRKRTGQKEKIVTVKMRCRWIQRFIVLRCEGCSGRMLCLMRSGS